jgi:hypothetical protein
LATKPLSTTIPESDSFRTVEHTGPQEIPMPVLIASAIKRKVNLRRLAVLS